MKAKIGHKFVLLFTFPSGKKYAAGQIDGHFAFIPIEEDGILRGVIAWDDSNDFKLWMDSFIETIGGESEWAKLRASLKPDIGQVKIAQ